MIKEVNGDILLSKAGAIAHGVAPFDHFDSGLALALRERWPALSKDFRQYCHQVNPKPGSLWPWKNHDGKYICNLMTQEPPGGKGHGGHPGRASADYVNKALHELKKFVETSGVSSVALPRIATGVGGLKWEDVRPLIQHQLGDLKATVYVYVNYLKGEEAGE